jgi:predicted transposase YbfD/YdcC
MKAIGVVEYDRHLNGAVKTERRYYILSRKLTPKQFAEHVRKHWEIENKLHWVLDMAYREDESRARTGNAQENLVMLRHLTLNLLREDKTKKVGIKNKRLGAGWDHDYLLLLLQGMVS